MNKLFVAASLAFASLGASASLTPKFDQISALPGETFNAAWADNAQVAIDEFVGRNPGGHITGLITLGLTVLPSVADMPTVSHNGQGIFDVTAGVAQANAASIQDSLATWSIGYQVAGAGASNKYAYRLLLDVDPSEGESFREFSLSANAHGLLNMGSPGVEMLGGFAFDPAALGQYSFVLQALHWGTGDIEGMTSVLVNVNGGTVAPAVPEPSTFALACLGIVGLLVARRRHRRSRI